MKILSKRASAALFITFLAAGVTLFGIGVANREFLGVMQKGIRVCLECIGIG